MVVERRHRARLCVGVSEISVRASCACGSIPTPATLKERALVRIIVRSIAFNVLFYLNTVALSDRGAADLLHALSRHHRGGEILGAHQSQAAAPRRRHRLRHSRAGEDPARARSSSPPSTSRPGKPSRCCRCSTIRCSSSSANCNGSRSSAGSPSRAAWCRSTAAPARRRSPL